MVDLGNYRRPHGLDLDPKTGHIVVTIENPDGLLLVDSRARKVLRKFDVQGGDPHMVLFGPNATHAYVSNTATATVAGGSTTFDFAAASPGTYRVALTVSVAGREATGTAT